MERKSQSWRAATRQQPSREGTDDDAERTMLVRGYKPFLAILGILTLALLLAWVLRMLFL